VFRPARISYTDERTVRVGGNVVRVPSHAVFADVRGRDTIRVELEIEHAIGTDMRGNNPERGEPEMRGVMGHPYFIQMKGTATVTGRVGGDAIRGAGTGFFETYR
jgi:hypothetical protein